LSVVTADAQNRFNRIYLQLGNQHLTILSIGREGFIKNIHSEALNVLCLFKFKYEVRYDKKIQVRLISILTVFSAVINGDCSLQFSTTGTSHLMVAAAMQDLVQRSRRKRNKVVLDELGGQMRRHTGGLRPVGLSPLPCGCRCTSGLFFSWNIDDSPQCSWCRYSCCSQQLAVIPT
jgi:phosphotransferase system HPr-like phosphotransfer protein